jgi:hypothetical protein
MYEEQNKIEKKIDKRLLSFINKNLFETNKILEKAILISLIPSFYMTKNGFFVIRNIKSNEDLTIKYLFRNYFPKTPTIVSKKSFNKLALNKTIYYRGVYKKEYVENFLYGKGTNSFSGRGQDMYTGTIEFPFSFVLKLSPLLSFSIFQCIITMLKFLVLI